MSIADTLLADPTFGLMTTAERREEALALIASAGGDPDDDLGAALAVEEAEERFAAGETAPAVSVAPERPPDTEDHVSGCEGVQIAGNGRCLGCGAQVQSIAPRYSSEDIVRAMGEAEEGDGTVDDESAEAFADGLRSYVDRKGNSPLPPKPPQSGMLAAFKAATRMGDRDIADTIGLARSSVQAIVSGRVGENLTPKQLRTLLTALNAQLDRMQDLAVDLEERISG